MDFKDKRILDVGCGVISVLNLLREGKRYGIDPLMHEYQGLYHLDPSIAWVQAQGEFIPYRDERFDIAVCSNVLDHVSDPLKVRDEICRVLKPGGVFILTVDVFQVVHSRDPAHPHSFTLEDLEILLRPFEVIFQKCSFIPAQVRNFLRDSIVTDDSTEHIVVSKRPRNEEH